jgi:EAL domain-containing protein (putative c-di-GMP-specific phosphodiesterase class I)
VLALLRWSAMFLFAAESITVTVEHVTGWDPLSDAADIAICALAFAALVAFAMIGHAERRIAGGLCDADTQDLAARRGREAQDLADATARRDRIVQVLEGDRYPVLVFQPIVDLRTGRTVGYEALSRFLDGTPDEWFAAAEEVGLGVPLELKAVRRALAQLPALPAADTYLSVNCSPAALVADDLFDLVAGSIEPGRVVVELTEHVQVEDYTGCQRAAARLRGIGARLAVDDMGAGYASLRHVIELRPEIIKLDRSLINVADRSLETAVGVLVALGRLTGAAILAEGVEDAPTVARMRTLGVDLAQGWYYGRPKPLPELAAVDARPGG